MWPRSRSTGGRCASRRPSDRATTRFGGMRAPSGAASIQRGAEADRVLGEMAFELWNRDSGNIIGSFSDEDAAYAAVRAVTPSGWPTTRLHGALCVEVEHREGRSRPVEKEALGKSGRRGVGLAAGDPCTSSNGIHKPHAVSSPVAPAPATCRREVTGD